MTDSSPVIMFTTSSDEQDIYQEFSFNKKRRDLVTGYQSKRNGDDLSAHVIQLGLSYNTKAKAAPLKPYVRDSFR